MTTPSRPRVLCVDDEPLLLEGLLLTLRRRFEVVIAHGGREALAVLAERGPFTVVLADFHMPGMSGAELLARARDLAPDSIRILLTGHATLEHAISAVNQGYIFRFLTKPCPPAVLLQALDDAVEQARLVTRDRELLEGKLEEISGHLIQAERLATLGTLAGAVGHELNNMLVAFDGALCATSDAAAAGRTPDPEDLETLAHVRAHLASHAKHLLHLGRPGAPGGGAADLGKVAVETVAMLRSAGVLRHAEVRLDVPSEPIPVRVDRTRLEQVLVNLLKNALDAVAEVRGRRAKLSVAVAQRAEEKLASCSIEDNGCGVAPEKLGALFEPYYTTKPAERGTGLGLFVVKQIVESSGGAVSVASTLGSGTTFTFQLPLH